MSKKFIVKVVYGRDTRETINMMKNLASMLQRSSCEIPIVRLSDSKCEFETPNCVVRYINTKEKLRGLRVDEIFGIEPESRKWYRRMDAKTEPYDGCIFDYIIKVETDVAVAAVKAAAEMRKEPEPEQKDEYDILEFLENVMGLKLFDYQKEIVKKYNDDFFKGRCKVVYGRGGKIYVVPVEESDDRKTEEVGGGEP